jgi:hypothetical protein
LGGDFEIVIVHSALHRDTCRREINEIRGKKSNKVNFDFNVVSDIVKVTDKNILLVYEDGCKTLN